jgi:DNA-binding response OmpR family regulator
LALSGSAVHRHHAQALGPAGDVHLTPLEYPVLESLARKAGMVVRQRQLLREVWGPDRTEDARSCGSA